MKTPTFLLSAVVFALAGCTMAPPPPYAPMAGPYPPMAAPTGSVTITTAQKAPFGTYLVDGSGRSLYILEGTHGRSGIVACSLDCARVWPPLMVTAPATVGAGLDPAKLGTAPRGGGTQLTYGGWPLFYYVRDAAPGDTVGHNVRDAWGMWHLMAPSGFPVGY